ncbi:MAG: plastocyanin/azurin family copper-binding protein [Thermodesulfobacteriota bacterium]|nr:MAG: plastocyanin/azurin family copper-binding protein [Thermodesulfobacteriota bacterium]
MERAVLTVAALAALAVLVSRAVHSGEIADKFSEAFKERDRAALASLVDANRDSIPAEVRSVLDSAEKAAPEEKEGLFYLADEMAMAYKDATGDTALLLEVKKRSFDSRLSEPVRSMPGKGVHIVDIPRADADSRDIFRPDNIIIKKGETVRWVNNDGIDHVFSSMPLIGKGGISAPGIKPGGSWEFVFNEPGEYYYICYIHRGMIGKVAVEE